MKKIKIVYSNYHPDIMSRYGDYVKKELNKSLLEYDTIAVPGSFEIPYEIARSIKEDTVDNLKKMASFKGKNKAKIRDNIVQIAKLSQLNLNNQCIYSGYLALGCIIKGQTINHQAISTSIFTNLQRISIENLMPISNGIFNANDIDEALAKCSKCAEQSVHVIRTFVKRK